MAKHRAEDRLGQQDERSEAAARAVELSKQYGSGDTAVVALAGVTVECARVGEPAGNHLRRRADRKP